MDHDEFDPVGHQNVEYPPDDEELRRPDYETRVTVSMSWQQITFIISINAILSLIISLAVVIIAGQSILPFQSEPTPPVAETESPMAVADNETDLEPSPLPAPDTPTSTSDETVPTSEPGETLPTVVPTVEPTIYIVQPDDTLGSIADKFEVSLEDLMRANGLADPDYVQVGQELFIPIGGLPPATATFTPVPIPTDTPLPFGPPTPLPSDTTPPPEPAVTVGPTPTAVPTLTSAPAGEIRLVLQILNPGDLANEMVEVVNQGPFVRLTDWTLSDEAGNVYTFPDFSLWGGGAVNVHTASGANTTTDLYWGQPNAVWDVGELVTLRDTDGAVVTSYTVPAP